MYTGSNMQIDNSIECSSSAWVTQGVRNPSYRDIGTNYSVNGHSLLVICDICCTLGAQCTTCILYIPSHSMESKYT